MTNPDFAALAARAEAGGDATLSDDVWRAMGWREHKSRCGWLEEGEILIYRDGPRPDLCTSIDAQAALPGRIVSVSLQDDLWVSNSSEMRAGSGFAPTEPLGRLAALLRAMVAKDPADAR